MHYPCCARFEILPIGRLPGAASDDDDDGSVGGAPPGGGICCESIDILTFRASNFKTCFSSSSTSPSFKRSSGDPRQQFLNKKIRVTTLKTYIINIPFVYFWPVTWPVSGQLRELPSIVRLGRGGLV